MAQAYDLTGQRFGYLTVLCFSGRRRENGTSRRYWLCRCDCGHELELISTRLSSGMARSCGCYRLEKISTHKLSKTPEYRVWASMRQRCENPNNSRYPDYGGRGIEVCRRWHDFASFYNDMGSRPTPDHSIDRIDNNGHYCPENCRWATRSQQQRNKKPFPKNNRLPKGDNHWTRRQHWRCFEISAKNIRKAHGKGEENPNSKLTNDLATQMRDFYRVNPHLKMRELGDHFGVGRETARKVIKEIAW